MDIQQTIFDWTSEQTILDSGNIPRMFPEGYVFAVIGLPFNFRMKWNVMQILCPNHFDNILLTGNN